MAEVTRTPKTKNPILVQTDPGAGSSGAVTACSGRQHTGRPARDAGSADGDPVVAGVVPDAGLRRVAGARPWPPPLPASQERFRPAYEAFAAGLLSDRGGPDAVTTAELVLIEATAECYVVARKLARRLTTRGVTKRRGEEQPALKSYFTAVNTLRLNLLALGLERRARRVDSYVEGVLAQERAARRPAEVAGGPDVPVERPERKGNPAEREGEGLA